MEHGFIIIMIRELNCNKYIVEQANFNTNMGMDLDISDNEDDDDD